MQGRKGRYGEIDDMSREAAQKQLAWTEAAFREMTAAFDYDVPGPETKLPWDLFEYQLQAARASDRFSDHRYPFEQIGGTQTFLPTFLINFRKVESEADYVAYVARMREAPRAFGQLIDQVKRSPAAGIRPPRFAHQGVIGRAGEVITDAPFTAGTDSALWADAQAKADALVKAGKIDAARANSRRRRARRRSAPAAATRPRAAFADGQHRAHAEPAHRGHVEHVDAHVRQPGECFARALDEGFGIDHIRWLVSRAAAAYRAMRPRPALHATPQHRAPAAATARTKPPPTPA